MTIAEIVSKINENEYLVGEINIKLKEGYLFPDTYFFARNTFRNDLLNIMFNKTNTLLDQFWNIYRDNIPLETKDEVLVMASIIGERNRSNK